MIWELLWVGTCDKDNEWRHVCSRAGVVSHSVIQGMTWATVMTKWKYRCPTEWTSVLSNTGSLRIVASWGSTAIMLWSFLVCILCRLRPAAIFAQDKQFAEQQNSWISIFLCLQIQNLLNSVHSEAFEIKAVQVSTVDAFQGAEKEIIVLSCVRTRQMGFIDSEKRMNVALTRAKRHLLIVGNLACLSKNRLWGRVIHHCKGTFFLYFQKYVAHLFKW